MTTISVASPAAAAPALVPVAVPPVRELRRPRRRRWLMTTAAVVALAGVSVSARPAGAITDTAVLLAILAYLEEYVVPVLEALVPLPETMDGEGIREVLDRVGTATRSYLAGASPEVLLGQVFPEILQVTTLDEARLWAVLRDGDRRQKVAEAMNVARTITDDVAASAERADEFLARNGMPFESLAGVNKLGNAIAVETNGTLKQIVQLQAEQAQLHADQAMHEDWKRRQNDEWLRAHFGEQGYWTGVRTWAPETMPALGGG